MTVLSAVIVDDEPLARSMLRGLLSAHPDVEVVGEAGDGVAALELIRRRQPDLVFLDIEMPARGGLEVAEALASAPAAQRPAIVFVTAYGEHAPRAFEVEALDYLVKPYSEERLTTAVARAKRRQRDRRLGELAHQVAQAAGELEPGRAENGEGPVTRLTLKVGDRVRFVPVAEVVSIESEDYCVRVHLAGGSSHLLRDSLKALAERLDPTRFARIHRTAIVNLEAVREVRTAEGGGREVVLTTGARLPIARSRRRAIEELLIR